MRQPSEIKAPWASQAGARNSFDPRIRGGELRTQDAITRHQPLPQYKTPGIGNLFNKKNLLLEIRSEVWGGQNRERGEQEKCRGKKKIPAKSIRGKRSNLIRIDSRLTCFREQKTMP